VAFFEQVRAGYLALASAEPDRFRVVDGSGSVAQSDAVIREMVSPLLTVL
jgi:dTMP kinase